ncbi:hypothetical protein AKJ16_DCAP26519, partial [Drosera capensis]
QKNLVKTTASSREEDWPPGLRRWNVVIILERACDNLGSMSFNTMLTCSPTSSTASSSDLDTESTGSFFPDRSITLGSLMGASSILELSRRSLRGRRPEPSKVKRPPKSKTWKFFSLCSRNTTDAVDNDNAPSLGRFLDVERRAVTDVGNDSGRNQNPNLDTYNEIPSVEPIAETNTLFINCQIAPPPCSAPEAESCGSGANGHGIPVLCSFMCGQTSL